MEGVMNRHNSRCWSSTDPFWKEDFSLVWINRSAHWKRHTLHAGWCPSSFRNSFPGLAQQDILKQVDRPRNQQTRMLHDLLARLNWHHVIYSFEAIKPATYCRHVDDIYVIVWVEEHLLCLKHHLKQRSVSKCTYELNVKRYSWQSRWNLRDKSVQKMHWQWPIFECPQRVPYTVQDECDQRSYSRRTSHCSTWQLFHEELKRSKHILIHYDNTTQNLFIKFLAMMVKTIIVPK